MNIALHTTQIPPVTSPHEEIVAIIDLTKDRSNQLLELMDEITRRADQSSTTFKISSFEINGLYVPTYALRHLPEPNDFIILPRDYSVTAVAPIKLIHANVMPHFINWSATDLDNRFTIESTELPAELLELIARGETLLPNATRKSLNPSSILNQIVFGRLSQELH